MKNYTVYSEDGESVAPEGGHPRERWHWMVLSVVLVVSGYCSLAYQVVWIREFRLVFGGTTGAVAAVSAVFMAGLGFGSAVLGRRVEKSASPLYLYALFEIGIALSAKLSPALLDGVRSVYLQSGGEASMGYGLATMMRLAMTAVVIGLPCFFMGGTLPAAVCHLQHDQDPERKTSGWLYGVNLFGALLGVAVTVFFTLEHFGNRGSLSFAVALNMAIGLVALVLSRVRIRKPAACVSESKDQIRKSGQDLGKVNSECEARVKAAQWSLKVPPAICLGSVFVSGLVFFMLELVWYRISVPLTGGSVHALGMVLLVALAGLALGGWLYAWMGRRLANQPGAMALLGGLQITCILIPYYAGDWYAWMVASGVRELNNPAWSEMLVLWFVTVAGIALLPSIAAGIQFPLLLSMLGRGKRNIGIHLGDAYAWNTFGAICGSLLGGFVLLPWLGAGRLWLLLAGICAVPTLLFLVLHVRSSPLRLVSMRSLGLPSVVIVLLILNIVCAFIYPGPGAYWRHGSIGFGRVDPFPTTLSGRREAFASHQFFIVDESEGREASIAVFQAESLALFNNGKSEGSVHGDAATNIGLALMPALLHREGVRSAAVIGAGTGISVGWLASFPGVENVDLLEIEPRVIETLHRFSPANLDPLDNPAVQVLTGDARETLATGTATYDAIVSQPSNLNRAGICHFYTLEYYRQCLESMNQGGIFCQWVQGYKLDARSLEQIAATMLAVFPRVELWVTQSRDVLFLGLQETQPYDLERIRQRMALPEYGSAMIRGFRSDSVEGLFAHFVADSESLRQVVGDRVALNTDDRNLLEFRVARQSLSEENMSIRDCLAELFSATDLSASIEGYLPTVRLEEERWLMHSSELERSPGGSANDPWLMRAMRLFGNDHFSKVRDTWVGKPESFRGKLYLAMTAAASPGPFEEEIDAIREAMPAEAEMLVGVRMLHEGRSEWGMGSLRSGFDMQRGLGWGDLRVTRFVLERLMRLLPLMNRSELVTLFDIIEAPFSCGLQEGRRRWLLINIACYLGPEYKGRAVEVYGKQMLSMGIPMLLAADIPDRHDARKALARFYRGGGKTPENFSSRREPGPGLAQATEPLHPSAEDSSSPKGTDQE
jgi:predicted membrane-bound spermidine synthase